MRKEDKQPGVEQVLLKKPRKNFIKALPRTSLLIFNMGARSKAFDLVFNLNAKSDVQLRSNALEAARQAANKYLEREIPNNYSMRVVTYPHNVIREKKFATGAGADRVSQGMTLSFGRPSSVAARVCAGNTVIEVKANAEEQGDCQGGAEEGVVEAFRHVQHSYGRVREGSSGSRQVTASPRFTCASRLIFPSLTPIFIYVRRQILQ